MVIVIREMIITVIIIISILLIMIKTMITIIIIFLVCMWPVVGNPLHWLESSVPEMRFAATLINNSQKTNKSQVSNKSFDCLYSPFCVLK